LHPLLTEVPQLFIGLPNLFQSRLLLFEALKEFGLVDACQPLALLDDVADLYVKGHDLPDSGRLKGHDLVRISEKSCAFDGNRDTSEDAPSQCHS
jgi:hypothetical protein